MNRFNGPFEGRANLVLLRFAQRAKEEFALIHLNRAYSNVAHIHINSFISRIGSHFLNV